MAIKKIPLCSNIPRTNEESNAEQDPIFLSSPAAGITYEDIERWNSIDGYWDLSILGQPERDSGILRVPLGGILEIEPNGALYIDIDSSNRITWTVTDSFAGSPAFDITDEMITQWNTAYSWGNHADENYLKLIDIENIPSYSITSQMINNWNESYSWGDHANAGYLTSFIETDPIYTASSWHSTTNNSGNWNTAYSWGDHATAGYLKLVDIDDEFVHIQGNETIYGQKSFDSSVTLFKRIYSAVTYQGTGIEAMNTHVDGIGIKGIGGYIGGLFESSSDSTYDYGLAALGYNGSALFANKRIDILNNYVNNISLRLNSANMIGAGAPQSGIGTGIRWRLPVLQPWTNSDSKNSDKDAGIVGIFWNSITKDAEDAKLVVSLTKNGVVDQTAFTVYSSGRIKLVSQSSAPTAEEGSIYYNSTTKHFFGYDGTTWKQLDN